MLKMIDYIDNVMMSTVYSVLSGSHFEIEHRWVVRPSVRPSVRIDTDTRYHTHSHSHSHSQYYILYLKYYILFICSIVSFVNHPTSHRHSNTHTQNKHTHTHNTHTPPLRFPYEGVQIQSYKNQLSTVQEHEQSGGIVRR